MGGGAVFPLNTAVSPFLLAVSQDATSEDGGETWPWPEQQCILFTVIYFSGSLHAFLFINRKPKASYIARAHSPSSSQCQSTKQSLKSVQNIIQLPIVTETT